MTPERSSDMKYPGLCVVAAALLAAASGSLDAGGPEGIESCGETSYGLISTLIREEYGKDFGLILVNRRTEPICLGVNLVSLMEEWEGLRRETIDSLIVANTGRTCIIEEKLDLDVEYRIVGEEEYFRSLAGGESGGKGDIYFDEGLIYSGHRGPEEAEGDTIHPSWESFDGEYPDAQGFLTFSMVGFDPGRSQALVAFSNSYRCSGDRVRSRNSKIAFFVRRGDGWELAGISRSLTAVH